MYKDKLALNNRHATFYHSNGVSPLIVLLLLAVLSCSSDTLLKSLIRASNVLVGDVC